VLKTSDLFSRATGPAKPRLGVNEVIWALEGFNPISETYTPVPARVYIVLDKPEKVESVVLPELRKWVNIKPEDLHKRGKPYISYVTRPNGSTITFLFFDQDPLTAEGIEGDFFWIDEPCPRNLFVSLKRGGRTKGRRARYLLTGTPIAAAWLRQDIYEKWTAGELPDAECFRFGTNENKKNLDEGYIDRFSNYLTEKERRIRLEGEFFDLDGLALSGIFDRKVHLVEPFAWPREWPVIIALDPHGAKPHHACMVGVDRENRLYYLKEMKEKSVPRDFARSLQQFMQGYRVVDIVCDSLGSSETSGGDGFKSFIQVLREERINVRATTYEEKQDEEWIARIQNVLTVPTEPDNLGEMVPKLRIFRNNTGIVADIENVQWLKVRGVDDFKPKLDISNKDFLACLKYALAANPSIDKSRAKIYTRAPVSTYGQSAPTSRLTGQRVQSRMKFKARRTR
jgi:hypothetical protein